MTTYELITSADKSYGVKATKVKLFKDISENFTAVKKLVDTCNRCDVDLDIFADVLENYLNDFTF